MAELLVRFILIGLCVQSVVGRGVNARNQSQEVKADEDGDDFGK